MNLNNLEKVLETEPKYRLNQAKAAVFKELIEDWTEASVFSLKLRQKLNKNCPLSIKAEAAVSKTGDAIKARITLKDGLKIESVLMRHSDGRNTVCVSSQAGCPLGCKFCATGKMGFKRNLESGEIIEQALFFARRLKKALPIGRQENKRITNVVFMGMGEPFLNYENVMAAIRTLNDKNGLNIGARKISVSTIGIIEGIKKLAAEKIQLNLAISLHAPNNKLRDEIMPINKKYPIEIILKNVDDYIAKTNRQVMFEYLLIKGINDSDACARELAKLMEKPLYPVRSSQKIKSNLDSSARNEKYNTSNGVYFLNLISYNPTGIFQPSSAERTEKFKNILKKMGVKFSQRYKFGQDIKAACGQFVIKQILAL